MDINEKIIWLAGLLEGEGSFGWRDKANSAWLHLGMTDLDVVRDAANIMNCYIGIITLKTKGSKTAYQISLHGLKAIIIMRKILPYMKERRSAKINEVILKYELFSKNKTNFCKRGHDLTLGYNVRIKKNGYRCCRKCDSVTRKVS